MAQGHFLPPLVEPSRLPPRQRRPLLEFALPATSAASGVMLGFAMPSIIDANSILDLGKAIVLTGSASLVAYSVDRLAIDRGAELGTTGYRLATAVSLSAILTVGGGLCAATYSGLTLKDAARLDLQHHGQALSAHVAERSGAASTAGRIIPVIRSAETDLTQLAACELTSSCVSGHRTGGNGSVAKIIQGYAGRAGTIAQQITAGETARAEIGKRLEDALSAYHATESDEAIAMPERRARLQAIDTRIRQGTGELVEAVPVALIRAYAGELSSPVGLASRAEAESRLNANLSRHSRSINAVLDTIKDSKAAPPAFPAKAGVARTFAYLPQFAPLFIIALVVDVVLPLVMFAFAYWTLAWKKFDHGPNDPINPPPPAGPTSSPLTAIAPQPVPVLVAAAEPARRGRPRRVLS